jgi:4-hydroxy-tetrahydrodipicolinate reductase
MGCAIVAASHANKAVKLVAGSVREGEHQHAAGLFVTTSPALLAEKAEAIIDFTAPDATLALAREVAKTGGIIVIGTTGFTPEQQNELP